MLPISPATLNPSPLPCRAAAAALPPGFRRRRHAAADALLHCCRHRQCDADAAVALPAAAALLPR
jgi:hypothetical protein